jgi:hypothetical protein
MPPIFGDLKKYCENTGWSMVRNTDHWYYEKLLQSGVLLRTRVSHSTSQEIPGHLWQKIKSKQICVSEKEFWDNV